MNAVDARLKRPSPSLLIATLMFIVMISAVAAAQGTSAPPRRELTLDTVIVNLPLGQNQAPLEMTLKQLMDTFKVPGLSVAVIDNYKIVWVKGFGVTERGGPPVTAKTLFQAGSISKPVAAAGALWLVEQGKLSLDEDVNQKLKTWKVPENEFTATEKVTLRRLVSHSAGLTVHGFPGYAVAGGGEGHASRAGPISTSEAGRASRISAGRKHAEHAWLSAARREKD